MQAAAPVGTAVSCSGAAHDPITAGVHEQIWTFQRGEDELRITRSTEGTTFHLSVEGAGAPRTYAFAELRRLQQFQEDFEKLLLGTGWTFVRFFPDRRSGRERRHFSRLISDRRRWWTDGLPKNHAVEPAPDEPGQRRSRTRSRL